MSHGEAVAVGMVAAGAASARESGFGEAERVATVLTRLGLPVAAAGLDADEVRRLVALDKKRDRIGPRMTLLRADRRPSRQPRSAPLPLTPRSPPSGSAEPDPPDNPREPAPWTTLAASTC